MQRYDRATPQKALSSIASLSQCAYVRNHWLAGHFGMRFRRVHLSRRQHHGDLESAALRDDHDWRRHIGAFLANNQTKVVKATIKGLGECFKGSKYTKARYMELMALMFDILQKARKEGLMAIEKDVEEPHESELFKKYPAVGSDHHVVEFITDYLRMMVSGNLNAHEIESLMDSEIETHHHEAHAAVAAIQRVAGGLPAFGIVAAVLGVVNTMGSVGQPPAVLGGMIGSALVGTFLGILLAYAFAEPLGRCAGAKGGRRRQKNCSALKPPCWPACRATTRPPPLSSVAKCCTPPSAPRSSSWKAM